MASKAQAVASRPQYVEQVIEDGEGIARRVMVHLGESPLLWLRARKLLSDRQFLAGEALRRDLGNGGAWPTSHDAMGRVAAIRRAAGRSERSRPYADAIVRQGPLSCRLEGCRAGVGGHIVARRVRGRGAKPCRKGATMAKPRGKAGSDPGAGAGCRILPHWLKFGPISRILTHIRHPGAGRGLQSLGGTSY